MGGGYGHLTRAVALTRAIGQAARVRILTNSPYTSRIAAAMPELELSSLSDLAGALAGCDCFVVDTFPRGITGELVDVLPRFEGAKVLVARDLNPRYVEAYKLRAFIERAYDLVLDAETTPWLIRNEDEILSRDEARKRLKLESDAPSVLICPSGNAEEYAWYQEVAAQITGCEVRLLSHWPAMELYAAADAIVGGAGYHTVNECLACGVPLVARPWPRKYDRQGVRALHAARVVSDTTAAVAAAQELSYSRSSDNRVIAFENGAAKSASCLLQLSSRSNIQGL
jgi:hypothetical protein